MSSPQAYTVSGSSIAPLNREAVEFDDIKHDPRGLIWMWEPPDPRKTYVMGIDPTVGIVGWSREARTIDDRKTDNGAIEIIRVGFGEPGQLDFVPDVQVAEYAAPVDPEDLANVANMLGRIYGGANEDGQCHCIIEVYPGPGLLTLRRMLNVHEYTNHFVWTKLDSMNSQTTASLGWSATPKSVRDLWIRTRRHIIRGGLRHWSPWLVEEWTDCEMDFIKQTGSAVHGAHDDRVRAINLCLWAAHHWSFEVETANKPMNEEEPIDWQASDVSLEAMQEAWEERWAELSD